MQSFRAHVHRQGRQWAWEVRQGVGAVASRRAGMATSRADAMRAAFNRTQLPEYPAALAA